MTHSLQDLSDLSGVEPRTIRSWIQQGLLPGPDTFGRNARYPSGTLTRLRAIRVLRDLYAMSLQAIRQELLVADASRIEALAAQPLGSPNRPVDKWVVSEAPQGSSAADYLRALRSPNSSAGKANNEIGTAEAVARRGYSADPSQAVSGSRLQQLLAFLEAELGGRQIPRKAKGDVRTFIPITPDLELSVRGNLSPGEIAYYERIADAIREFLSGGPILG